MTRTRIVAAAFLLSALAAGAPAANAHTWPGAGAAMEQFDVEIPAGALPPGPATGELSGDGSRFRVRFEMPATGPAHVTFWRDYRSPQPPQFEAVIRSDRGRVFRTAVEPTREARRGPPLFLGTADQLAAFSRAVGDSRPKPPRPANGPDPIAGIELGAPSEIATPDCRRLAFARYVVVALNGNESVQGLLDCAARGAGVLIIGRLAGEPDAGALALARLGVGSRIVPWGSGSVVWYPEMRDGMDETITRIAVTEGMNDYNYLLTGSFGSFVSADPKPKGVPGASLVFVLLALYVVVIGPIGYFVGVRPRRAWLAWSWFPLVALGATIALTAVSTVWRGKPAELVVNRTWLVSPTGAGLQNTDIRLQGSSAARYSVSVPWRDGDLRSIERGYRFGTPFAQPAGSLAMVDDRIAGRLDVDGLTVGRFGTAGVSWVEPVALGGIDVARRGGDAFTIANHMGRPIRRAVIRGARLCGLIEDLGPGGWSATAAVDCETLKESTNPGNAWHRAALAHVESSDSPGPGAVVVVAEIDDPSSLQARPSVKTSGNDIVVMRGPLVGGEGVP
jgi:hypothetical protein